MRRQGTGRWQVAHGFRTLVAGAVVLTLVGASVFALRSADIAPAAAAGAGDGLMDPAQWRARQDSYLAYATTAVEPGSALNVLANIEQARRDPNFHPDLSGVTPAAMQSTFDAIDNHQDTTDFSMMYLLNLVYGGGADVPSDLVAAIDQRLVTFEYWYTEPTPPGVVDQKWYWSENHRLIFHTIELLAGNRLPTAVFQDGRTGAEHAVSARARIMEWLEEHAQYGFSEWHSDVYYQKDIAPLLTLVEFAGDVEVSNRAEIMLDLVFLDIAANLQKGNFGSSHGRSYMKDKSIATDQDVFNVSKLVFDDTSRDYTSRGDASAMVARASRYRPPAAIVAVAKADAPMVDRERMGVPLDIDGGWESNPVAPPGHPFDDPDQVPFWWERGALTAWQVVPLTFQTMNDYDLWSNDLFSDFAAFQSLSTLPRDDVQKLAAGLSPQIGMGMLSEVNTYTWRGGDAMLSSAQDYRPGMRGSQYHAWQATLDEGAVVFTTHPGNAPRPGTRWVDADMYWTGTASMPRTAQQGATSINIYDPAYTPQTSGPLAAFGYLDETHAFFPTERFDEVTQVGNWTIGRKGDGYVALWSWRPVQWSAPNPAIPNGGLTGTYDLVAPGGARNVWIAEVGERSRWGSFAAFRDAITAAPVDVTDSGGDFSVAWSSPSEGQVDFSQVGPLTVNGSEVPLHDYPRMDNPYVGTTAGHFAVRAGAATLDLDTNAWTRVAASDTGPVGTTVPPATSATTVAPVPETPDPARPVVLNPTFTG